MRRESARVENVMLSGCNGLRMIGYMSRNVALYRGVKEDVFYCFCTFPPPFSHPDCRVLQRHCRLVPSLVWDMK